MMLVVGELVLCLQWRQASLTTQHTSSNLESKPHAVGRQCRQQPWLSNKKGKEGKEACTQGKPKAMSDFSQVRMF